ncbi:MAG TPA: hypothetical protein PKC43_09085 [Phycisphaerales bacterium]|nr:hypothetical protein [Phycisphaerales bacterium]HMP37589.1 hypothetical protein [Phycisphaerales bacterium]
MSRSTSPGHLRHESASSRVPHRLCAACALVFASGVADSAHSVSPGPRTSLIGSFPITPPPSPKLAPYLPQFWSLLSSYNAATANDRQLPFGLWLMVNGVVDPPEHHAMLALYAWWMETTRRAAAAT